MPARTDRLVLAIDTCGPEGSVALGRCGGGGVAVLGQRTLPGKSYSATLIQAVAELLAAAGTRVGLLDALVAVHGPGSFTGVRVGLAAVKGLAEPGQTPVVAVSRLAVLAAKAGTEAAALDAHRQEVYLRLGAGAQPRELLAGAAELAGVEAPLRVGVCDDASAALLAAVWPAAEPVRSEPPTAADALAVAAPLVAAGSFADLALLDGNYLRRSDAEIFGEAKAGTRCG